MNRHLARNGVLMLGFLLWAFAPTSRSQDQTTGVLLTQPGHWTLGVLVNNVWSVAGSGSRPDVNQFLLQYFINYNMKKGWFITWQPILPRTGQRPVATNGPCRLVAEWEEL